MPPQENASTGNLSVVSVSSPPVEKAAGEPLDLDSKDARKTPLPRTPPKKVYLFSFPPVPHVYSISPFTLKVESFLRLYGIPHEVVPTFKFSSKGQMPYIRLDAVDGEEVADSNVIIRRLREEFGLADCDAALTDSQRAVAHMTTRMLEEHTAQIGFYFRYGLNIEQFAKVLSVDDYMFNKCHSIRGWVMSSLFRKMMPLGYKKRMKSNGLGRHKDEELWAFSNDDIQAISHFLADKPFFFGDEATTIDCVLFGHLVQFLDIPLDFPQQRYINEHCTNLVRFIERFKDNFWKDWDEKCNPAAQFKGDMLVAERLTYLQSRGNNGKNCKEEVLSKRSRMICQQLLTATLLGVAASLLVSRPK